MTEKPGEIWPRTRTPVSVNGSPAATACACACAVVVADSSSSQKRLLTSCSESPATQHARQSVPSCGHSPRAATAIAQHHPGHLQQLPAVSAHVGLVKRCWEASRVRSYQLRAPREPAGEITTARRLTRKFARVTYLDPQALRRLTRPAGWASCPARQVDLNRVGKSRTQRFFCSTVALRRCQGIRQVGVPVDLRQASGWGTPRLFAAADVASRMGQPGVRVSTMSTTAWYAATGRSIKRQSGEDSAHCFSSSRTHNSAMFTSSAVAATSSVRGFLSSTALRTDRG